MTVFTVNVHFYRNIRRYFPDTVYQECTNNTYIKPWPLPFGWDVVVTDKVVIVVMAGLATLIPATAYSLLQEQRNVIDEYKTSEWQSESFHAIIIGSYMMHLK